MDTFINAADTNADDLMEVAVASRTLAVSAETKRDYSLSDKLALMVFSMVENKSNGMIPVEYYRI